MLCELCNDPAGGDHNPKHIKNKTLYDFSQNQKKFAGNRKGVVISCKGQSINPNVDRKQQPIYVDDGKIKISAKPNEVVKFEFRVLNETNNEDILVVGVQLAHPKLGFMMNDHGMEFGGEPHVLRPKQVVPKHIDVKFSSPDVGQYEMPIIFFFRKTASRENLVIIREMIVFVEYKQVIHEKIISPYANKEVKADKLVRSLIADKSGDMFRIPKTYKRMFSNSLKLPADASAQDKAIADTIKEIFQTGVTEDNYIQYFHNLLWYEETIVRINLKKYNMSDVPLCAQGDAYLLNVPGLAEKRPSLMLGDIVFVRPHNNDTVMFEGVILKIDSNTAHICGLHPMFKKYSGPAARFDVRFFMSRMPLERMHRAVHCVSKVSQQSRVFPRENTAIPQLPNITTYYNPLVESNPEQRTAVEHIVAGTAGTAPYVLHGPPGTGKTVTIVEAILQLVKANAKNHILVCTDSNMAADHVARQLIQYHHMFGDDKRFLLRANSQFRVWDSMPVKLSPYSNGCSYSSFKSVSNQLMDEYRVVVTTLSHAAKFGRSAKARRPVTHLFIDEAAQASEPACLIPVCGLLDQRGCLVLAGDPMQLGPVVISHDARRRGLGKSLMERLKESHPLYDEEQNDVNYTIMLRNNFRSHVDILEIPNHKFYGGNLRAHARVDPLSNTDILGERGDSRAIVFHGVRSKEQRVGKSPSYYNSMELEVVKSYITALTSRHQVAPEDIGVVTPYIRQVYKVKEWLVSKGFAHRVEVGTVEAFQGKEKRVIIISTVRANCALLDHDAKFQLGFLVDDKRFNVALTRAKAKAIVVGNPLCLQRDLKWRTYIQKCREFGTYFGFDANSERSEEIENELVDRLKVLNEVTDNNINADNKKRSQAKKK